MNASQLFVSFVSRKKNNPLRLDKIRYVVKDPSQAIHVAIHPLQKKNWRLPFFASNTHRASFFYSDYDCQVVEVDAASNLKLRDFEVSLQESKGSPLSGQRFYLFEHHVIGNFELFCTSLGLLVKPVSKESVRFAYFLFPVENKNQRQI